MTATGQRDHANAITIVRSVVSALRLTRLAPDSEDISVALARLENWLDENDGRWTR